MTNIRDLDTDESELTRFGCGFTIVTRGHMQSYMSWYNLKTDQSGKLPSKFVQMISDTKYLIDEDFVAVGNTTSGDRSEPEFESVIHDRLVVQTRISTVKSYVPTCGKLFYLPRAKTCAMQLVTKTETIYVTGGKYVKKIVQPEPDMVEIKPLDDNYYSSAICSNFIIIYQYNQTQILFTDGTSILAIVATIFDEESVIYRTNEGLYYKHILYPAQRIDWPSDIMIKTLHVCGRRIVFNPVLNNDLIYVADIEYAYM